MWSHSSKSLDQNTESVMKRRLIFLARNSSVLELVTLELKLQSELPSSSTVIKGLPCISKSTEKIKMASN